MIAEYVFAEKQGILILSKQHQVQLLHCPCNYFCDDNE